MSKTARQTFQQIIRTKIAIIAIVSVDRMSNRLHVTSLWHDTPTANAAQFTRWFANYIMCCLYDNISCLFVTTIVIAVYMQIIIYNSGITVCNQFIQRHNISLQQIRTTQQPAHQLFDLFILSAILQASNTELYGVAKHLLLIIIFIHHCWRSLLTGDVLIMVRFGLSHGPF